jgi:hypothetical protein
MSDEKQGQRRNSWRMQADSTQKLEPVMQVLHGVFRRRSQASCLPLANQANLPSRHSHKTEQSSSSKTTQESKAQSVENGLSIPAKMLHPTTPIHAHTHNSPLSLSQPPSLTLTLQQHQDIVLLDGSLHHQRRSRNTAACDQAQRCGQAVRSKARVSIP